MQAMGLRGSTKLLKEDDPFRGDIRYPLLGDVTNTGTIEDGTCCALGALDGEQVDFGRHGVGSLCTGGMKDEVCLITLETGISPAVEARLRAGAFLMGLQAGTAADCPS